MVNNKDDKKIEKKGFWARLLDKLDQRLSEKAQKSSCCCCSDTDQAENKKCC